MKPLVAGCDTVFHQAALRITQCAAGAARRLRGDGRRRPIDLVELCLAANIRKMVVASSASVYGMADQFPTTEAHHPYNNRTLYGAAKAFNEGLLRSFNDMYGLELRRAALLQRLRPAHGHPRPLHRGAGALDGAP